MSQSFDTVASIYHLVKAVRPLLLHKGTNSAATERRVVLFVIDEAIAIIFFSDFFQHIREHVYNKSLPSLSPY